jgi:hypothetical protein
LGEKTKNFSIVDTNHLSSLDPIKKKKKLGSKSIIVRIEEILHNLFVKKLTLVSIVWTRREFNTLTAPSWFLEKKKKKIVGKGCNDIRLKNSGLRNEKRGVLKEDVRRLEKWIGDKF